jgi:hypothetical protein
MVRTVTREEVDHLHEHGWVKLDGFVDHGVLADMLDLARARMGEDADSNPAPPPRDDDEAPLPYFNAHVLRGLRHPVVEPLIRALGAEAKQLLRRRRPDGTLLDARYYEDLFAPKLPSSAPAPHGGNGPSAYHQDFIGHGADRSGGLTFWVPLEAYTPEAGTMTFLSGSHRLGVVGNYGTYGDGDARTAFPELTALERSEPMTYALGDVTVHTDLTVHGAGANVMDRPRWTWLLLVEPEDVCWNGAPCLSYDTSTMTPWQPMDGPRFPIIS